jgi:hypothetical protein
MLHMPRCLLAIGMLSLSAVSRAEHDLEYVAEHLPEVAMDNRYATLPLWGASFADTPAWGMAAQAAVATTQVGTLRIEGPLLAIAARHSLGTDWNFSAFGFYDRYTLSGDREFRPLQTLFAPDTPLQRPVDALFTGLDGDATHYGVGASVAWRSGGGWLREHRWVAGLVWQRVELRNYRFHYEILAGPQLGTTGGIDFDADYAHVAPFFGLEVPRDVGNWRLTTHALAAYPIPRRGVVGHITGPEFDLAGDTENVGNGKHFGDPSLTLGFNIEYRPAHLSVDLGTLLTQALLEPVTHPGIDKNYLLSLSWAVP